MKPIHTLRYILGICVLICIIFAFTPPGQALARQIIHFFNPADGSTFPLAPQDQLPAVPEDTDQNALTQAEQAADQITNADQPEPFNPTTDLSVDTLANMDSQTAGAALGWRPAAPSKLPQGYLLTNITYDPTRSILEMRYGGDHEIVLTQGTKLPKPAINNGKSIKINGQDATLGSSLEISQVLILAWSDGKHDLTLSGEVSENTLSDIAKAVTICADADESCQIGQAGAAAGFQPMLFAGLPSDYAFNLAYYYPGATSIWFSSPAGELGLNQATHSFSENETSPWFGVPADTILPLTINGQPAEYVNGSFVTTAGSDHATWMPDSGQIRMRWQADETYHEIVKWGDPVMTPQELADLAASLTTGSIPLSTRNQATEPQPADTNPILSLAELKAGASIPVFTPQIIPQGMPFSHGLLTPDGVVVFYGVYSNNYLQADQPGLIVIESTKTYPDLKSGFDAYPADAFSSVTVAGKPALIVRGSILDNPDGGGSPQWMDDGLICILWNSDGLRLTIVVDPDESGASIPIADLVQIAESMQ